ncbi:MAG: methyltransferase domain-containing protein [Candidatus Gastranaerophilales bacterium]|nr:methyltransferase domain-containing protein [Candidatus Gastranaerophilales bacterium]
MQAENTLEYYNKNAKEFAAATVSVEFESMQRRFADKLSRGARILDFGCGSGRDAKYFLDRGYLVEAADGSEELCKIASEYAGIPVRHMLFEELDETDRYDGIWACSSILHLRRQELSEVMRKMACALKDRGIIYTSFKYGDFEGERNGRYFTDMTEVSFLKLMEDVENLRIEEQWVTSDVRPGRGEERWLNLILRKE